MFEFILNASALPLVVRVNVARRIRNLIWVAVSPESGVVAGVAGRGRFHSLAEAPDRNEAERVAWESSLEYAQGDVARARELYPRAKRYYAELARTLGDTPIRGEEDVDPRWVANREAKGATCRDLEELATLLTGIPAVPEREASFETVIEEADAEARLDRIAAENTGPVVVRQGFVNRVLVDKTHRQLIVQERNRHQVGVLPVWKSYWFQGFESLELAREAAQAAIVDIEGAGGTVLYGEFAPPARRLVVLKGTAVIERPDVKGDAPRERTVYPSRAAAEAAYTRTIAKLKASGVNTRGWVAPVAA